MPHAAQSIEPVHKDTTFNIWTRLNLRTVQESYPLFDKASLRAALATEHEMEQGAGAAN